jgi:hypothetical protein
MSMMFAAKAQTILENIQFRDWTIYLGVKEGQFYLQCRFNADGQEWSGRKWNLSVHMTRSEIVQTALKAVLTAVEHEAREHFRYKGRAIFGPHINVDDLLSICEKLDVRKEA